MIRFHVPTEENYEAFPTPSKYTLEKFKGNGVYPNELGTTGLILTLRKDKLFGKMAWFALGQPAAYKSEISIIGEYVKVRDTLYRAKYVLEVLKALNLDNSIITEAGSWHQTVNLNQGELLFIQCHRGQVGVVSPIFPLMELCDHYEIEKVQEVNIYVCRVCKKQISSEELSNYRFVGTMNVLKNIYNDNFEVEK